ESIKKMFIAHTRFLSDDLCEGRGPGSKGMEIASKYITSFFEYLSLKPAFNGSYYQWLETRGSTLLPEKFEFTTPKDLISLEFSKDYIMTSNYLEKKVYMDSVPVVFVGYGIKADEYKWDDFKGMDVKGKVLLFLVNDPPSNDPRFFDGNGMTYYGRWTYKFEEAERRGAIGALIIHITEMAGYGWDVVQNSWSGEQIWRKGTENKSLRFNGWITKNTAEKLFESCGTTLTEMMKRAGNRKFKPVPLPLRLNISFEVKEREIRTANLAGIVEGKSRKEEYIVFSAHYDHLGFKPDYPGEDKIFNGALDNASGVSCALIIAKLLKENPPERSVIIFIPTLEEAGLDGTKYFVKNPCVPKEKILLNINVDSLNIWGIVNDFVLRGIEYYDLKGVSERLFEKLGLKIKPDPHPEFGSFFRSDHFPFAVEGIPAVSVSAGNEFVGKPADYSDKIIWDYISRHYHKPSDEFRNDWDMNSVVQEILFVYELTREFADSGLIPEIKPMTSLYYWSKLLKNS
ncbi:MAG: M28 family peptidase, partial [Candidatus Aminicenantia bacterium]